MEKAKLLRLFIFRNNGHYPAGEDNLYSPYDTGLCNTPLSIEDSQEMFEIAQGIEDVSCVVQFILGM